MSPELVVRGQRVVQPGFSGPASIHVRDGVISAIEPYDSVPPGSEIIDAGPFAVLAGLVDTHVHFNDPGRADWEGFASGTRAAAAGGITSVVDMPLNSIPGTIDVPSFQKKLEAAEGNCWVDVGFWGGVVPGNAQEIEPLLAEGVLGFKCFLIASGVDEFPCVSEADLRKALPILAAHGTVLLAHAELPGPIESARPAGSRRAYSTYLASRPRAAENEAIALLVGLSREFAARVHIVHLSSSDAIVCLRQARERDLPVTVETCPHYLFFKAEEIPDGATEFKCAPPIRESENRETLWKALEKGDIDLVASDHSPCHPKMKAAESGDFFQAWGGISSLQFSLTAVWTEARRRGIGLEKVSHWLSAAPARLAGLAGRKGSIAIGADADLVIFDPDRSVDWNFAVHHRHKLTPYQDLLMRGAVQRTILRGRTVYCDGWFSPEPKGQFLRGSLYRLNHGPAETAVADFLRCCGSLQWAARMTDARPYRSIMHVLDHADSVWQSISSEDWLEAFGAHPKIGEHSSSRWSKQEQSGVNTASDIARAELAELNEAYYDRFGFIFIICATGKSAPEMLEQLRCRLGNTRETEISNAAGQQRLITRLRLRKLLTS